MGGGTDVDVCYEVTYGLIMMLLPKQLRAFPQSMQQRGQWAAHLILEVDMPTCLLHATLAPGPSGKFIKGKRY